MTPGDGRVSEGTVPAPPGMMLAENASAAVICANYVPQLMRVDDQGALHFRHDNGIRVTIHPAQPGQDLLVPKPPKPPPMPTRSLTVKEIGRRVGPWELLARHWYLMLWELVTSATIWFSIGLTAGIALCITASAVLGPDRPNHHQPAQPAPTHEERKDQP